MLCMLFYCEVCSGDGRWIIRDPIIQKNFGISRFSFNNKNEKSYFINNFIYIPIISELYVNKNKI